MHRPFLVFEDTSVASRHALLRLFGVQWTATPYAWLSPLFWYGLGVLIAAFERRDNGPVLLVGVAYGVLLLASNVLHTIGHLVAGRLVNAPMAVNIVTATRDVVEYREPGASAPSTRRVVRALGGPLANLMAGGAALIGSGMADGWWMSAFGRFNVAIGLWTLLPIPTLDGWVVWGTVCRDTRGPRR